MSSEMQVPIRILHVLTAMNRAGTETMLMNLYRAVNRDKVQFDFAVTTTEYCDYDDEITSLGGKIIRYPKYTGRNHLAYKKWWNVFFRAHPEYRIVHGHIGSTAAIYLSIAKRNGRYTIAHSHGTLEPLSLRSIVWRMYSYPTRYVADYFFGCSMAALKTRYGTRIAHNKNISKVLNNAIDAAKYIYDPYVREEVRKELSIPQDEWVLGTVGRLSSAKNPMMIIKIIEELKNRGEDFKFLWVGEGELRSMIEEEISKRGLSEYILMLGVRDDIPRILQAMDIFIFPSLWEGLGMVAVEAQAAGLLTLCSDRIPQEAKVSNMCLYISADDTLRWTNAIVKYKKYERINTLDSVIDKGYDIHAVADWLQAFYLEKYYGD